MSQPKLGVHTVIGPRTGYGDFLHRIAGAGRKTFVFALDDSAPAQEAKSILGNNVTTLFRMDSNFGADLQGVDPERFGWNPASAARWYMDTVLPAWDGRRAFIDYFCTTNEWSLWHDFQSEFHLECMDIAEPEGYKLGLFAFSSGNPPVEYAKSPLFLEAISRIEQGGHVLSVHEYGLSSSLIHRFLRWLAAGGGYLQDSVPYHALRVAHLYQEVLFPRKPKCIVTETAYGNGEYPNDSIFMENIRWYAENVLEPYDFILGCTIFTLGNWGNANFQGSLGPLAEYISTTNLPEPSNPIVQPPFVYGDPMTTPQKPRGAPRTQYKRRYVVIIHAEASKIPVESRLALYSVCAKHNVTVGPSADDAGIGDLDYRDVVIYAPEHWGGHDVMQQWYATEYPGVNFYSVTGTPDDLDRWLTRNPVGTVPPQGEPFWIEYPVWPSETGEPFRITDPFNAPRPYANKKHEGIDIDCYINATRRNAPIHAAQDGTVIFVQPTYSGGTNYGIYVVIDHPWWDEVRRATWYCHLSSASVTSGQQVKRGDVVGIGGHTGTELIHLHFNLQDYDRGLDGYFVPKVVDPAPLLRAPSGPPPPSQWTGFFGVGTARSGDWTSLEISEMKKAKLSGFKFKTDQNRDWSIMANQQADIPLAGIVLRLFYPTDTALPSPQDFLGIMRGPINEQLSRGVRLFQVLNEPNIEYWMHMTAAQFALWLREVYNLFLSEWPGIKLISPPMGPNTNAGEPQKNTFRWMDALQAQNIFRDSFLVGAHSYWGNADGVFDINNGFFFTQLERYLGGKQMSILEFSNNQDGLDSDSEKALQYIEWSKRLPQYVHSVFGFALSADDPLFDARRETWVRRSGTQSTVIPSVIGAR